jgi:hypothetical protein
MVSSVAASSSVTFASSGDKGVAYLLTTPYANGGWFVKTRSFPVQEQFDSGFPFGYHQWISSAATSWAAMAIAYTLPDKIQPVISSSK